MKKKLLFFGFISILICGLLFCEHSSFIKYDDKCVQGNHDWEMIPSWTASGRARDENGNEVDHYYCLICGEDLTIDAEQRIWEKYDCGKGAKYWKDLEEFYGNTMTVARDWHDLYYNRTCVNVGHRPFNTSWTEPAYYECKICGQRKAIDGGRCRLFAQGSDCYDEAGNYIGKSTDKEVGVNRYCLQNNLKPKYYEAAPDQLCPYNIDGDSVMIISGDKVYDNTGKLVIGPALVVVKEKSAYNKVFVKNDGTILKSAYFAYDNYLYNTDSFGGVSLKPTTIAITYDNKLYSSDGSGVATLLTNTTVNINGVKYVSDENGNVTNNSGGSSPGQTDDGSWRNDPANNPSGTGYKNEYRNGVWYDGNGKASSTYRSGHWTSDSKGWWYQDGSYFPVSSWVKIDGYWYYFCADGYMDYSEYREGCWLNADGSWNESYSGGHWNEWSPGSGWWWYTDNTGYYPNGGSCWIDGHQYQFDADGWTYAK